MSFATGAMGTSFTVIVVVTRLLSTVPSRTLVTTVHSVGPCASVGVQLNEHSSISPPGQVVPVNTIEQVSVCTGMSSSVSPNAYEISVSSSPLAVVDAWFTGATFTSLTVIVVVTRLLSPVPSLTLVTTVQLSGPSSSVGVQLKVQPSSVPLLGQVVPASTIEHSSVSAGTSTSVSPMS